MTVTDPAKLLADCCAAGPLDLVIERIEDGVVVASGVLEQPFALIGRDPYCDIHLNDPEVALRHAFAQVIGGHVYVVDLSSTTGVHWPGGREPQGWLVPGEPLRIGPFHVTLTRPAAAHPTALPADFRPLQSPLDEGPGVVLEFRTGIIAPSHWEINRTLTLVGRAAECKLHLAGEDIGLFHCYLLKTIAGLWVMDLRARAGVHVNGQKIRLHLLQDGDVLRVGLYEIGVKYPKLKALQNADSEVSFEMPPVEDSSRSVSSASARIGAPGSTMTAPAEALPAVETPSGLSRGSASHAAMVPVGGLAANLLPALRQMAEQQAALHAQFQESLAMVLRMVAQMSPHEGPLVEAELARLMPREVPDEPPVPLKPEPFPLPQATEAAAKLAGDLFDKMTQMQGEKPTLWQRWLKR
jgi:pSer/pThr/pTyr-binding forkhead associated (FHA) protein